MTDWMMQLKRLDELRKEGLLTETEFQEQKKLIMPNRAPTTTSIESSGNESQTSTSDLQQQMPQIPPSSGQSLDTVSNRTLVDSTVVEKVKIAPKLPPLNLLMGLLLISVIASIIGLFQDYYEAFPISEWRGLFGFALTLNIACPTLVLIASLLYRGKEANSDKFFALSVPMLLTASSVLLSRSLSDLLLGQFRPEWGFDYSWFGASSYIFAFSSTVQLGVALALLKVFNSSEREMHPSNSGPQGEGINLLFIAWALFCGGLVTNSMWFSATDDPIFSLYTKLDWQVWIGEGIILPIAWTLPFYFVYTLRSTPLGVQSALGLLIPLSSIVGTLLYVELTNEYRYYGNWLPGDTVMSAGVVVIIIHIFHSLGKSND